MDFEATHSFQGIDYIAWAQRDDNSDFSWGAEPLNPSEIETIWLYSSESWDACDSAEYGIKHGSEFLIYPDGTETSHTVDEVSIL